jgi:hypothetical protein
MMGSVVVQKFGRIVIYRVSTVTLLDYTVFSPSKKQKCGLIIGMPATQHIRYNFKKLILFYVSTVGSSVGLCSSLNI